MTTISDHGTINSYVTEDERGLDLLKVFLSTRVGGGYSRYGRVNSQGGITYIVNRQQGARPGEPTLIISKDEAKILANSLMNELYGGGWDATRDQVDLLKEKLAEAEEENGHMRRGKKNAETKIKELQQELKELREMQGRYRDVMAVVTAVNSRAAAQSVDLQDCAD